MSKSDSSDPAGSGPVEEEVRADDQARRSISDQESNGNEQTDTDSAEIHPRGFRLFLLLISLFLGNFLVGYDSSCIGTLTPVITDQFNALNDLGWYQTAYLLGLCAPMLIYGRLYSIYSMKKLYISSFFIFIVGSILTAASPASAAFILGRTLNGVGAAGINAGVNIIISHSTPLKTRPIHFAICGGVECAALAFGPLIAGSIAASTTWRVCFYIVVPIAVFDMLVILFGVPRLRRPENANLAQKEKIALVDWAGLVTELPMTVCFILALQWGGTMYEWGNWRVVVLFVVTGVLAVGFLWVEHKAGEKAMVPLRMLRSRTVSFAGLVTFCNFAALWAVSFYLPLYFQAVRGASTLGSGLMYLPVAISMSVFALIGGPITTYIGYYSPILLLGTSLSAIGTGLLTTLHPHSSAGKWIGYQVIYGMGIGMSFQPPFLAVQTVLEGAKVPMALVLLSFTQTFGGILVLSVAQNVFLNKLAKNLVTSVPQVDPNVVLQHGAIGLINVVPVQYRDLVLTAYNKAIVDVFYIALGLSCLSVLCAFGIEWKSVKKPASTKSTSSSIEEK
ncbi:MFS transporter-like protein [Dothistroma septosporum NZE10]|uniref:MFS transporter-like protein n=1 Tax=Dothistroma septosporum (strain NZE10 / CBS 128990) TaxID=675120 RepID=N1PWY5_DOTSN|nr:MFS transporter-like protein [Dothistroma septosporum NZE10]